MLDVERRELWFHFGVAALRGSWRVWYSHDVILGFATLVSTCTRRISRLRLLSHRLVP